MTARVIVVECCKECPHILKMGGDSVWCRHPIFEISMSIIGHDTIPDWCPLPKRDSPELLLHGAAQWLPKKEGGE